MALVNTTKGPLEESTLAVRTGFEEWTSPAGMGPNQFVVWKEWRLGDELVKRDAHVILKEPSVIADALAANL